ncbi:response regulator [Roseateles noduli]|uniref:response regulator n=1 Tax=Roseateles noduli TaxID=2052484 RepID=UPI003D6591E4
MTSAPLIVIVEDDQSLLHAQLGLLRACGYRAMGFESAEQMLESTQNVSVDLVATDIHMGAMDGFELSRELRRRCPDVPVIMLTASNDKALESKAIDAGALCLLTKPLDGGKLLQWIEAALGKGSDPR